MQKIFHEVATLDARCYETYALTPELLMEHAALALAQAVREQARQSDTILIVAGSGHNGADGIACARILAGDYHVTLLCAKAPASPLAQTQLKRAQAVGVAVVESLIPCDVLIDALYGWGLNRSLDTNDTNLITGMNNLEAFKIACDIPSGIHASGMCEPSVFKADLTLTMGALKLALFSNEAKNFTGTIRVIDLGISHSYYAPNTPFMLLEASDMKLPFRLTPNVHKGTFGHVAVFSGEKVGASILTGLAALRLGAGLVTLVRNQPSQGIPYELMSHSSLPATVTAVCVGMGWGKPDATLWQTLYDLALPMVLDADLFYDVQLLPLLEKPCVLTPHPKEFLALLSMVDGLALDMPTLETKRFELVQDFSVRFPRVVLVLKGANTLIAHQGNVSINPYGSAKLSKAGSGDVLAGIIGALLAQGYTPLEAAITGSLAHTQAAQKVTKNSYALSPRDLIDVLGDL